jgi:anthranilate phosphoribosyltransferase
MKEEKEPSKKEEVQEPTKMSSHLKNAISLLIQRRDLTHDEALFAMEEVMSGSATQSQIGAFLTALRMKGETVMEIGAFAEKMREKALRINPRIQGRNFLGKLTDTCGTGGDKLKTFNVSTISAFVVSGAGVPIAKHGNRSVTSKCGSADLLERLGVNINASPLNVERSIETCGIGFMLAPTFHPAMKHVASARKEIGIRTVFNILGPLINPALAEAQLVGVYDDGLVRTMAEVLKNLGVKSAIVSHGLDGLDEISVIGRTHIAHLHEDGTIIEDVISPADFGLKIRKYEEIAAPQKIDHDDIAEYASLALKILTSSDYGKLSVREQGVLDMVLANASGALVVSGAVDNFLEGVEVARNSIESRRAFEKLVSLVKCSNGDTDMIKSILPDAV